VFGLALIKIDSDRIDFDRLRAMTKFYAIHRYNPYLPLQKLKDQADPGFRELQGEPPLGKEVD
jgi:hypothetical protein